MVCHEYFRALNIIQKWPLEYHNLNKAHLKTDNLNSQCNTRACSSDSFGFFRGMIGLICHLQQKELGHGAVANPIYRFAIYYKFLWLLGPLSHRFVDCLLSWVLMSCCLNHCIITALIHFLAYPHTWSVGSPLLEKNGLKHSSLSRQLVTSSLKRGVILRILPFNKWHSACDLAECCHRLLFQVLFYVWIKWSWTDGSWESHFFFEDWNTGTVHHTTDSSV